MSPVADKAARFLPTCACVRLRRWEGQHGELRHCLAESPVISRSWTCRDCCLGWRSGVHTITVYPTGELSTGGKSALWPPYTPDTSIHSPHTSSHTFLTYSHYWPVHLPLSLWYLNFTPQKKGLYVPLCAAVKWAQWKPVDKHKKGASVFGTLK